MYAPATSWWTSWAPTATPVPRSASPTAARQTNGGQMTRSTDGSAVRAAIVAASSPASAGVVFIFQLAAMMTGRIDRIMPERGRCADRAGRPLPARRPIPSSGWSARCSIRSSARWAVERWTWSRSASSPSVASGVSRRASATRRTIVRLDREPAVGLELLDRRELAAGRPDGPLEVRRLRVEDPVQVAAQRPRHLARLELEQRAARPDPAQEQPDGVGVLPGDDAAAAPQPPRRRQLLALEAGREERRLGGRDDELEVGPAAGQAERAPGEEQAAEVGQPAVLGRRVPVERIGRAGRRWPRDVAPLPFPSRTASRATGPSRAGRPAASPAASARRSHGRDGSIAASSARRAATRSRSGRVTLGSRRSRARGRVQAVRATFERRRLPLSRS